MPMMLLSEYLGHANVETTKIYAYADTEMKRAYLMIWRTLDLSPLAYLIPSVAAEVATGTGFYYSKAKVENRIKLMKQNKVTPNDTHFSENY